MHYFPARAGSHVHGKLLPPRSTRVRLVRGSSGGPMRVISFAPSLVLILGRVAGVTNPETNLGGQAVRPASETVRPSISTERTWLRVNAK